MQDEITQILSAHCKLTDSAQRARLGRRLPDERSKALHLVHFCRSSLSMQCMRTDANNEQNREGHKAISKVSRVHLCSLSLNFYYRLPSGFT